MNTPCCQALGPLEQSDYTTTRKKSEMLSELKATRRYAFRKSSSTLPLFPALGSLGAVTAADIVQVVLASFFFATGPLGVVVFFSCGVVFFFSFVAKLKLCPR